MSLNIPRGISRLALALGICGALAGPVAAEDGPLGTVGTYQAAIKKLAACSDNDKTCAHGLAMAKLYLVGLGQGMATVNAVLATEKKPLLYCQPDKLGLGADNYLQILNDSASRYRNAGTSIDDKDLGVALLFALQDAFPCSKTSEGK